jgi:prepilin-type N-terminal cleavage/methylation domain-containing protein
MLKNMKTSRGFTLIELLVVIAIISLLASVVLASVQNARVRANNASRLSLVHQYEIALSSYFSANGSYPQVGASTIVCIGQNTNGCQNGRWPDSASLRTALAPYINSAAIPPANTSYSNVSGIAYFNCPFPGECTHEGYGLYYYVDGANASCGAGRVYLSYVLARSCMVIR